MQHSFTVSRLLIALVVVLLLSSSCLFVSAAFNAFPAHQSSQSYSDISLQVGLGAEVPLRVSTLIDWQNNKNIDLIGIREDNPSCIEARTWDRDGKRFNQRTITPGCDSNNNGTTGSGSTLMKRNYTSAAAVDINRDGLLDLVATHQTNVDIIFQQPAHLNNGAIRIQQDVLTFPTNNGSSSNKLLPGSSVNVVSYFSECGLHDIVAVNDQHEMFVFRNDLDSPPNTGGSVCVNGKWSGSNVSFVAEPKTKVTQVVPAGTATVDLDGNCASEFVFARTNASTNMMEIFVATKLASKSLKINYNNLDNNGASSSSSSSSSSSPSSTSTGSSSGGGGSQSADDGIDTKLLISVPSDFGAPTWSDFNGDGAIDVAFAVCVSTTPTSSGSSGSASSTTVQLTKCTSKNNFTGVLTILNQHSEVCPSNECCHKFSYSFASVKNYTAKLDASIKLSGVTHFVKSLTDGGSTSASSSSSFSSSSSSGGGGGDDDEDRTLCYLKSASPDMIPLKIRPGDINDDSKTDAVVSSTCGPILLKNRGSGDFTPELFVTSGTTQVAGENSAVDLELLSRSDALPFFFDINDDGRLDLIVLHRGNFSRCPSSSSASSKKCLGGVFVFWHRTSDDRNNYFITAATLNGATALPSPSWGAIQLGATVRFQHLDIDNDVHTSGGTQIPSTAYFELALPRPHFGIGLTFASVMNFASGFNVNGRAVENSWISVYLTPNSQILCVPHPITDPSNWAVRLYLLGEWDLQLVLVAWLISLAVIGIPILALGVKEVNDDRKSFGLS